MLIGNGQRLFDAVNVGHCQRRGIEIARRVTGGGAVFMSPRVLAWDVVLGYASHGDGLAGLARRVCEAVAASLAHFGASARFEPPNAITIDGAKISGTSGYVDGNSAVLQGTVLIEDDAAKMAAALGVPEETLRQRVSCLAASLKSPPSFAELQAALLDSLANRLQRSPMHAQPDRMELTLASQLLRDEIGTEDYVIGADTHLAAEMEP